MKEGDKSITEEKERKEEKKKMVVKVKNVTWRR